MTQIEASTTSSVTGKWKPYPAYKDSGVEWLGEIPESWNAIPLKRATVFVSRGNSPEYVDESSIRVINQACVYWDGLRLENVKYYREENISELKGLLQSGDLLINSTGTGTLGRAIYFDQPGTFVADSHVTIVRTLVRKLHVRYLLYLIRSLIYQGYVYAALVSGSTNQVELSREGLRATPIILPSLSEQLAIATFLDHETIRLKALVSKKERLIELLQEKRAALISHAVTKGLDPRVPMKDSGVEWLGGIPAHWEVKRLKFCLDSIEQGWSPTCENRPAEIDEWGVLKVGCVNGIEFHPNENKALPAETQPISELEIKQGDVLVSRANTRELLGSASVVKQVRPHLLLCDKLYRLKILPDTVNSIYLVLAMGSSIIRFQLEREATGASNSMQNISQSTILNLIIPLPDLLEQQTIVAHLDRETAKIDALISKISGGIEKLKEYSTTLISTAVTGKIDVRGENTSMDDKLI